MIEIIKEIESRKITVDLNEKRVACARCGSTWIELVGLIVGKKEGLRIHAFISVWNQKIVKHVGFDNLNVPNAAQETYMK